MRLYSSLMMSSYKCFLACVKQTHSAIPLPHRKAVLIGRSPATGIVDKKVSRHQVELVADCVRREVSVKQLGVHACSVDNKPVQKGETAILKRKQLLHLVADSYPHEVTFELQDKPASGSPKKSISDFFPVKQGEGGSKKRPANDSNDGHISNKKSRREEKPRTEMPDSDDDEEVRKMEDKLKMMRDTVKSTPTKDAIASTSQVNNYTDKSVSKTSNGTGEALKGELRDSAEWMEKDTLMVHRSKRLCASHKVAAFDIDGTIICTQSGKVFPTHSGDWRILFPEIPGALKKLHSDGYKIVFITNQMGIQRGKVKIPEFQQKVEGIIAKMGVPVHVLVSKGAGPYRKPGLGMWKHLIHYDNDGIKVDVSQSMYIGDAAGRPKDWAPKKKKDFSCSDRLFALNAGLQFYTPEEYFLKKSEVPYNMPEFDPRKLDGSRGLLEPVTASLTSGSQEIIVMVGSPASGKSHFVRENLISKGYIHVNRDLHKTWQKCVAICKSSLDEGKSVVVDNTNPEAESRKRYTDVGKKKNVPCRCFVMNTTMAQAKHNERFREMTDKSHQPINDMILNSYKSKFAEPALAEGFTEIVKVNIVPRFRDSEQETLYRTFLMDK